MKKDVIVSITGTPAAPYSDSVIETISSGIYNNRNGIAYIRYTEIIEEGESVSCIIKIKEDSVEISKKGKMNLYMLFDKEKKCMTSYRTPFGDVEVSIYTKELIILRGNDEILIKITYDMMLGFDNVSENNVEIKISSKN